MDDIEDLILEREEEREARIHPVKIHDTKKIPGLVYKNIPGTAVLWSKTFGCSHNVSDGEYMDGALTSYGYTFTDKKEDADLWLVNSCTVKDPSQSAFENLVKQAKESGKGIVVSGCVPQGDRKVKILDDVSMVGVTQIDQIVDVVEQTLAGNTVKLLGKKTLPSLDIPKVRKNKLVEIVPLSTGCLGSCTYCKTKHARGVLGSYDPQAIESRVRSVLAEDCPPREIWLASEDTGAYGRDLGTDIATLLLSLTNVLETESGPETMLRLGMTNPPFILAHLDRIANALRHPNMFKFLHIPVQAGSDAVLSAMNREYTVDEFRMCADYMIKHVPGITIATDIICGFPGETEEDFEQTLELIEEYKFPILNISQFYPRPGTPAANMKRIDTKIVKSRSKKVTVLFDSYLPYTHLLGKSVPCWICEEVSKDGMQTIGHTESYVKVVITPRDDSLIGTKVNVKITDIQKFHCAAQVINI